MHQNAQQNVHNYQEIAQNYQQHPDEYLDIWEDGTEYLRVYEVVQDYVEMILGTETKILQRSESYYYVNQYVEIKGGGHLGNGAEYKNSLCKKEDTIKRNKSCALFWVIFSINKLIDFFLDFRKYTYYYRY